MLPYEWKWPLNFVAALCVAMLLVALPARGDGTAQGGTGARLANSAEVSPKTAEEIAEAEAGIKADPANASAHVRLAFLLIRKGALDDAMKSFDEALRLNPRSHDAKTGKGILLAGKGNLKEAEQVLKDALVLNPNPVRTHYELGLVYERLNDFEKAAAEFKEGIKKHEQGRM